MNAETIAFDFQCDRKYAVLWFYLGLVEDRDKTEKAFFPGLMKQIEALNKQVEDLHMQVIMA